ncbi:MAG: K(+)-stimulated pyrophosphate-energized sodium pump, partial [Candidatus Paceibacteria bacterium]
MDQMLYIVGGCAVFALIFAITKFGGIMKKDAGDATMQEISKQVQDGAAAFLKAEYTWLTVFVVIVGTVIAMSGAEGLGGKTAFAFVMGAIASGVAGYFGMHTATRAAVRTTQGARTSLTEGLNVAFSSGIVMGMSVVGLALLGVVAFTYKYAAGEGFSAASLNHVLGFSFGASSIALFSRVGGGIFTKAADVGADLVGKVEAGIPEDDPRNPGTIADNVGDNVGDVAGMGADLFESYVGSIIATMILGASAYAGAENMDSLVLLPLGVAGLGIIASMIGTLFVKAADESQISSALHRGVTVASILAIAGSAALCLSYFTFPEGILGWKLLVAIASGTIIGILIGKVTEYYTGSDGKPVINIAKQSETGAATNIIHGLATGMESVAAPVLLICVAILISYSMAGV